MEALRFALGAAPDPRTTSQLTAESPTDFLMRVGLAKGSLYSTSVRYRHDFETPEMHRFVQNLKTVRCGVHSDAT